MTDRELLQQALDALISVWNSDRTTRQVETIRAIKARLAQPEPEPIAWIKARELTYMKAVVEHGATYWKTNLGLVPEENDMPLYTAPPQREWKGLTAEQIASIPRDEYMLQKAERLLRENNS